MHGQFQPARRQLLKLGAGTMVAGLANRWWSRASEPRGGNSVLTRVYSASGSTHAVVVGDVPLAHTAQIFPPTMTEKVAVGDAAAQLDELAKRIDMVLRAADSNLDQVVRWNFYVADDTAAGDVETWLRSRYPKNDTPAVTIVTGKLANEEHKVAADCIAVSQAAVRPGEVVRMADAAILPPRDKLYVSGDAKPGDLTTATTETLKSLEATLTFAKLDWSHVVHLKSFLQPIEAAGAVRDVMKSYFGDRPMPALTFVEWESAGLPIEIELIAAVPPDRGNSSGDSVEYLTPPHMKSSPVFSRAARVRCEKTIYTSGLYGASGSDAARRVREILDAVGEVAEKGGGDLKHLVKATYYVSDDVSSEQLNKIRPDYYDPTRPPAASKALVRGVGKLGQGIVVDMIAVPKAP